MNRVYSFLLILSNTLGYLAFCIGAYFVWQLFIAEPSPSNHELGMGVGISILYGLFPGTFSLLLAIWKRRNLSKNMLVLSTAIVPSYIFLFAVTSSIST
ncbi:hypothetical protein [Thalassomonas actiniarum]|uniref:Uncharacterized protein n=1 Tax=Thalassomonas actiniarum TaxID=485447 RepID=A0AAE9YVA8_9GAMM|nr:hypothetical protein [Thalassomonas actiniarum]WDE01488.1 hypothetical protein SG35_013245 [Thalassomonas actiniarum]